MWGVELTIISTMIAVNSVFAAYEIALASVSLARLELLAGEQRKGAAAAVYMKRNLEGSLAGIQLGITLVGAIAAATGGAGAEEQLAPSIQASLNISAAFAEALAIATVVIPLTFITIIFGELVPKVFALRNQERVCLAVSPGMKWFVSIVWPVVWLLERVVTNITTWSERRLKKHDSAEVKSESRELQELRATVALARTSRLIGVQEEHIILSAASLVSRPVANIMLAADAINMLEADGDIANALIAAHLDMHTRFPVTERKSDPQAIIGYVNFKDIVAHMRLAPHSASIKKITRPIPSFAETVPISTCLEQLIRGHVHIALVRNPVGLVVGMVTLEDIIEELVGDIEDEYDHLPTHTMPSGRGWVVGGGISLAKLMESTGIELPTQANSHSVRNLNEWVLAQLTAPLRGGEVLERGTIRLVVRKVRRQKVLEAQVETRLATTS